MRRQVILRANRLGVSRRIGVRVSATLAITVAVAVAAGGVAMTLGDYPIPLGEVYQSLIGMGSPDFNTIVLDFRLPRVLSTLFAGVALGLSGAIFQSFARNPLVSPDIIGVNTGAALVAVALLTAFSASQVLLPVGAFAGAILAAAVVYSTAQVRGLSPYRLVLIGIGVDALCRAGISFFLIQGDINQTTLATLWMVGSMHSADIGSTWFLAVALLVLLPAAAGLRRPLELLQMGDDTASALGTRVGLARLGILLVGVLLAASAVAVCGPVAFVAFVSPHLARKLSRAPGPAVFPVAAAIGALLLLLSDVVAVNVFPVVLPLGVITPVLGGPYLLYLLFRVNSREEVT